MDLLEIPEEEMTKAEYSYLRSLPPFSSTIGNEQLKTALLLALVDPKIGGVLAIGPKGTGKSRTIRSLCHIAPKIPVVDSKCPFSCPPIFEMMCTSCKEISDTQEPLKAKYKPLELVYLPISTTEEHLVGSFDVSQALSDGRVTFQPGLLARANRNILVIEEVNLLPDPLIDVIMSVVDEKTNRIERDGISSQHPVSTLIFGAMNREEGELRPHFGERFGLSAFHEPAEDIQARLEIIRENVFGLTRKESIQSFFAADQQLKEEIQNAKERLLSIESSARDLRFVSLVCEELELDGARVAEVLYRTARALCALRGASSLSSSDFFIATQLVSGHRTRKGGTLPPPTEDELKEAFQRAIERDRLLTDDAGTTELEKQFSQIREKKKLYERKRRLGAVRVAFFWILVLFFVLLIGFQTIFRFLLIATPFAIAALILTDLFIRAFLGKRFLAEEETEGLRSTRKTRTYYRETPWALGLSHPIVGIAGLILFPASIHFVIILWTGDPWTPWGIVPYLVVYIALALGFSKPRGGKTPLHEIPTKYEREYEYATEDILRTPVPDSKSKVEEKSDAIDVPVIDRNFLLAMRNERPSSPAWDKIYTTLIAHTPESFRSGTSFSTGYRASIFKQRLPPVRKKRTQTHRIKGSGGKRAHTLTNLSKGRVIGWKTPTERPRNIHLTATVRQAALRQARIAPIKKQREKTKELFVKIAKRDVREKRYLWKSRATIVFVLDLSRSMEQVLRAVQEAILFLHHDAYRKRDRVGLVACKGTEAAVIQYPTTNINLVAKHIDSLGVGGLTPLASGVLLGLRILENELKRDRECVPIMIVVSDGGTNVPLSWDFKENRARFLRKTYELWTGDGVKDAVNDLFLVAERVHRARISTISIVPFTPYDPSSAHGFSAMKGFQEITRGQMFMPSLEGLQVVSTIGDAISEAVQLETASSKRSPLLA